MGSETTMTVLAPPGSLRHSGAQRRRQAIYLVALAGFVLLLAIPAGWLSPSTPAAAAPPTTPAAPAAAHPQAAASGIFLPYCYKIDINTCVSIQYAGEPDVVPPSGQTVAPVYPNPNQSLPLIIKSRISINGSLNPAHSGPNSPIALNVTGTLWNGDPYYSTADNSIWHSASNQSWWKWYGYEYSSNKSYPFWYEVNISATSGSGANFFAGMQISWWIEVTYNITANGSGETHSFSRIFQYRYGGAWPYSPYPGTAQFAGTRAASQDVNLTVTPPSPNWNDALTFSLSTTAADTVTGATIGGAFIDIQEYLQNGSFLRTGTVVFPATAKTTGVGVTNSSVILPASWAQEPNATVGYTVTIFDAYGDRIVTPGANYTVRGNGSFNSGIFTDDIGLSTNPAEIVTGALGTPTINPGQSVGVDIVSANPTTSISAARLVVTATIPLLNEVSTVYVPMSRNTSVHWTGSVPAMPLGVSVSFVVDAWDFNQRLEVSPALNYVVPDLQTYVPVIPGSDSFFFVAVYDNGTGTWVSNATVQIQSSTNLFNTFGRTVFGLAYPNQTRSTFVPLLIPANLTYTVSVTDPMFFPAGARGSGAIVVNISAPHAMTARQTIATGADYLVLQEGNLLLFWLNSTAPSPPISASLGGTTLNAVAIAATIGVVVAAVAFIPIIWWWKEIRDRRAAEERRITL